MSLDRNTVDHKTTVFPNPALGIVAAPKGGHWTERPQGSEGSGWSEKRNGEKPGPALARGNAIENLRRKRHNISLLETRSIDSPHFHAIIFQMQSSSAIRVTHPLEPVWSPESTVLLLGTMPSPASRQAGFYYMHPQNRFWHVLPAVFGERLLLPNNASDTEAAITERKDFLIRHNLAIWDVLASCQIEGAADSSIKQEIPNDFTEIFTQSKIRHVFLPGKGLLHSGKSTVLPMKNNSGSPVPVFRAQARQMHALQCKCSLKNIRR